MAGQMENGSEQWQVIEGYGGKYAVSNMGEVKNIKTGLLLKKSVAEGYHQVSLSHQGKAVNKLVHRLVGQAFIPNPDNKPEINHKWGKKFDNRATELEWVTKSENVKHSFRVLKRKTKAGIKINPELIKNKGSKNGLAKLVESEVIQLRSIAGVMSQRKIAKLYNISHTQCRDILNRVNWKHI